MAISFCVKFKVWYYAWLEASITKKWLLWIMLPTYMINIFINKFPPEADVTWGYKGATSTEESWTSLERVTVYRGEQCHWKVTWCTVFCEPKVQALKEIQMSTSLSGLGHGLMKGY